MECEFRNPGTGKTITYDVENRTLTTNGVTYTYDGDGKRVEKACPTEPKGPRARRTGPGRVRAAVAERPKEILDAVPHLEFFLTFPTPSRKFPSKLVM